jgi:tetraacyldisaccharide 4'-kinase
MRAPSRPPDFWWQRGRAAGYALAPLGMLYGMVAARRMDQPGVSVGVPVICIGNLVLGGAGKTPTAIEVAEACRQLGLRPAFLTRGYGGAERGPVLVSQLVHTAREVGDEALLLSLHAPTVVAAERPLGARLLTSLGFDVIVMDDGFQNPSLIKDLALVVVEAGRGIGNGLVFPAGPLRAPLVRQIQHADALVVLGEGRGEAGVRVAARAGLPVLRAHTDPVRRRGLKRKPYLAFAGIANPGKFYSTLAGAGATIGLTMDFPDHHPFSDPDCAAILAAAEAKELVPITTEKDRMRLVGLGGAAARLLDAAETFPVRVQFAEPKRLLALIDDAVGAYGSAFRRFGITASAAARAPA